MFTRCDLGALGDVGDLGALRVNEENLYAIFTIFFRFNLERLFTTQQDPVGPIGRK